MKENTIKWQMTMELIVGAFMFLVLAGLFYFTIILSQQNLFTQKYPLQVKFPTVMGLRDGDNIVVRGMPVGKVKKLILGQDLKDGVVVVGDTEQPLVLHADYQARIITTSILGGRYLEIYEGTPDAPLIKDMTLLQGERPFDLMEEASALVHDIKKSLNEGGILKNLEATMADVRSVANKLNQGEGTLGKLLNDKALYEDFTAITKEVRSASVQLNEIVTRVNRGEGTIGKLLKEDAVYNDLTKISGNLRDISQRLAEGKGTLGKLLSEDDKLYKDISDTASSLKNVMARIERGEGTLGKLVNDDKLYENANGAIRDLQAAIDDFRETSPITSFTSILFGAF